MLSTVSLVVAGLSTGNKIALSLVGGAFILFAVVSSLVLPARYPNFPGRSVGWYSALAVLFLVAMISAVLVFGVESEEEVAGESKARTETVSGSLPGQTTESPGTTTAPTVVPGGDSDGENGGGDDDSGSGGGNSGSGGGDEGDAAAGKAVFTKNSCGSCHTLKAAGTSGDVGPNLDSLKPGFDEVKDQVEHGGGVMPAYEGTLSEKQIEDVAAYVSSSAGS
jgi:cytochrome c553